VTARMFDRVMTQSLQFRLACDAPAVRHSTFGNVGGTLVTADRATNRVGRTTLMNFDQESPGL
jgi:hypothetical protein